jgi:hypothetical protein
MKNTPPQASRMLNALKKERLQKQIASDIATSFKEYWNTEGNDV